MHLRGVNTSRALELWRSFAGKADFWLIFSLSYSNAISCPTSQHDNILDFQYYKCFLTTRTLVKLPTHSIFKCACIYIYNVKSQLHHFLSHRWCSLICWLDWFNYWLMICCKVSVLWQPFKAVRVPWGGRLNWGHWIMQLRQECLQHINMNIIDIAAATKENNYLNTFQWTKSISY